MRRRAREMCGVPRPRYPDFSRAQGGGGMRVWQSSVSVAIGCNTVAGSLGDPILVPGTVFGVQSRYVVYVLL